MSNDIVLSENEKLLIDISRFELQQKQFDFFNRRAKMLACSSLVPKQYRIFVEVKRGNETRTEENPNAIANCIIAMELAYRMGVSDLEIIQNLYIIDGRPSWSSQWLISVINSSGKFYGGIDYEKVDLGEIDACVYETSWQNNTKTKTKKTVRVRNKRCRAFVLDKNTHEKKYGPWASIEMAVQEGWYGKDGSKWQTEMQDLMLEYRAASFLCSTRCPELKYGLRTKEEEEDIVLSKDQDGSFVLAEQDIELDSVTKSGSEKVKELIKEKKQKKEKENNIAQHLAVSVEIDNEYSDNGIYNAAVSADVVKGHEDISLPFINKENELDEDIDFE